MPWMSKGDGGSQLWPSHKSDSSLSVALFLQNTNLVVIDICPLLLSNSKKILSVKPLNSMDRFARADFAGQSLCLPVKGCDVAAPG